MSNTIYKGDNAQLSIVEEDAGFNVAPSSYSGAKIIQNNDGSLNATRTALESAARTPIAELAGARLGNKQVAGNFPTEIDPFNQGMLWESLLYGTFSKNGGTDQDLLGTSFASATKYQLTLDLSTAQQTALGFKVGNVYLLKAITETALSDLVGAPLVAVSATTTSATFLCPQQRSDTLAATTSDVTVIPLNTLRPAKAQKSFNIEERLYAEAGGNVSRFMTTGGVVSGANIDLPAEGIITSDFSFLGARHLVSLDYNEFDSNLTNSQDAHTNLVEHTKYDPMVLQDGAIITGDGKEILCQWLSGSIGIENGTEMIFTGCSYEAKAGVSGKLAVTVNYEALFEGEEDFQAFEAETQSKLVLHLKDRATDQCFIIYLPSFKRMEYTKNVSTGLVSASITARAIIDPEVENSMVIAQYDTQ